MEKAQDEAPLSSHHPGERPHQIQIDFDDNVLSKSLYGEHNENLKAIEQRAGVSLAARGNRVSIQGEALAVDLAAKVLVQLYDLVRRGFPLYVEDVKRAVGLLADNGEVQLRDIFLDTVFQANRNRAIAPKGLAQKRYVDAMRRHDLVFAIGPAGTGKTYLAMAAAVASLSSKEFKRIILTRPAVEAGERLGFLPGTLYEKVNPYLRPLYDALHDMMDMESATRLVERGTIEIAPLAFMRGRTLNNSFIILDEAQNTTATQMKMFLTRLGFKSKAVITGDITQVGSPGRSDLRADPRPGGAARHRRHRLLLLHRGGRRAPPARAAHHPRLRGRRLPPGASMNDRPESPARLPGSPGRVRAAAARLSRPVLGGIGVLLFVAFSALLVTRAERGGPAALEAVEVGQVAKAEVRATAPLYVPDEETTRRLRDEAERKAPLVYVRDPTVAEQRVATLRRAFFLMRAGFDRYDQQVREAQAGTSPASEESPPDDASPPRDAERELEILERAAARSPMARVPTDGPETAAAGRCPSSSAAPCGSAWSASCEQRSRSSGSSFR
jgi:phosphate starvation-inducible PhoH-like protein